MISGVGPYGAAMSRAVTARADIQSSLTTSINTISSGTSFDFKRNAVNSGISRNVQSQLVGWDNARRNNERSINRLDVGLMAQQNIQEIMVDAKKALVAASDESLSQTERGQYIAEYNTYQEHIQFITNKYYGPDGEQFQAVNNAFGFALEASAKGLLTLNYGPGTNQDVLFVVPSVSLSSLGDATSASGIQSYLTGTFEAAEVRLRDGHAWGSPFDNVDEVYSNFSGPLRAARFEFAQQHIEKMAGVLEEQVAKLNALDMKIEVSRMQKLQQQETMAMSAMQIANQGMQTYVQALSNTSAAVGRLASGRF